MILCHHMKLLPLLLLPLRSLYPFSFSQVLSTCLNIADRLKHHHVNNSFNSSSPTTQNLIFFPVTTHAIYHCRPIIDQTSNGIGTCVDISNNQ